jgi:hypothetical protein
LVASRSNERESENVLRRARSVGTGQWVDLDEDGNIVKNTGPNSTAGASSVERISGSALQTLQVNKPNPAKFGGQ